MSLYLYDTFFALLGEAKSTFFVGVDKRSNVVDVVPFTQLHECSRELEWQAFDIVEYLLNHVFCCTGQSVFDEIRRRIGTHVHKLAVGCRGSVAGRQWNIQTA